VTLIQDDIVSGEARPGTGGETLTDRAYRELEEQIVTMQLRPGAVLSEATLTAKLGIGRTPIREALQRLAREDLVVIMPRRGVMVSDINVSRQLLLVETRRALETVIMCNAARRATARERKAFAELAEDLGRSADANDPVAFMRHDQRINLMSVQVCRNPYAARMATMIQGLSRRFWYRYFEESLDLPRCARLHQAEAQAIADGDPDAAARAVEALMDYTEEFTRASV